MLIAGSSGSGKSTLVRAISGLWPWGGGEIDIQKDARLFLLPQRPYVPIGSLRRAVAYPGAAEDWDIETIAKALERVGLGHLKDRIEEDQPWDQTLSGGEKQRLTVARVLLHRPDIIVLDEATAALDPKSQDDSDEASVRGDGGAHHRQRRAPAGTRAIPFTQADAGAKARRRQAGQRYPAGASAAPAPDPAFPAARKETAPAQGGLGRLTRTVRPREIPQPRYMFFFSDSFMVANRPLMSPRIALSSVKHC